MKGKNQKAPIEGIETNVKPRNVRLCKSKNQKAPIEGIETCDNATFDTNGGVVRIKKPLLRGLKHFGQTSWLIISRS